MKDYRLIYEHFTAKAFRLERRKELYLADADYFDGQRWNEIAVILITACYLLKKNNPQYAKILQESIEKLSAHTFTEEIIFDVLDNLPIDLT